MNPVLLNIIIKTIPKTEANQYEESRLIIKSRSKYKKEAINDLLICIFSIIAFICTDKIKIPYIGTFLFLGGFFGSIWGALSSIRAYFIYKAYYQIFSEDEIKKLEPEK